jgi:hypothetical protein
MRFHSFHLLTGLLVFSAGCTSWSRLTDAQPMPGGTVQLWSGGEPRLVREAKVAGDILMARAALPDTARLAVPLSAIDSVRIQRGDPGKAVIVGSGIAIVLLLAYAQGLQGME